MRPPLNPRSRIMPKPPKPFFGSLRRAMLVFHRTYGVMDMEAHVFLDFKAWHKKLKEDDTKPLEAAQKRIMQKVCRSLVAGGGSISAIHTRILKPDVPRSGNRHDAYHRNLARFLPALRPIVVAIVTDYELPKRSSEFGPFFQRRNVKIVHKLHYPTVPWGLSDFMFASFYNRDPKRYYQNRVGWQSLWFDKYYRRMEAAGSK